MKNHHDHLTTLAILLAVAALGLTVGCFFPEPGFGHDRGYAHDQQRGEDHSRGPERGEEHGREPGRDHDFPRS